MLKDSLPYFFSFVKKEGLTIFFFGFIIWIGTCGKRVPFFREAGGCEPPIGLFLYHPDKVPQEMAAYSYETRKTKGRPKGLNSGGTVGLSHPEAKCFGVYFFTPQ